MGWASLGLVRFSWIWILKFIIPVGPESIICVGVGLSDKNFKARPYLAQISSACSLVNELAQISLKLGLTYSPNKDRTSNR